MESVLRNSACRATVPGVMTDVTLAAFRCASLVGQRCPACDCAITEESLFWYDGLVLTADGGVWPMGDNNYKEAARQVASVGDTLWFLGHDVHESFWQLRHRGITTKCCSMLAFPASPNLFFQERNSHIRAAREEALRKFQDNTTQGGRDVEAE